MKHGLHLIIIILLLISPKLLAQQSEQVPTVYEVIISPNPVETRATFKVSQGNHKLTEIIIYDLIGKEVLSIQLSNGNGDYPIDLTFLRPGVYFCTVFSEKGVVETRKLVRSNK